MSYCQTTKHMRSSLVTTLILCTCSFAKAQLQESQIQSKLSEMSSKLRSNHNIRDREFKIEEAKKSKALSSEA